MSFYLIFQSFLKNKKLIDNKANKLAMVKKFNLPITIINELDKGNIEKAIKIDIYSGEIPQNKPKNISSLFGKKENYVQETAVATLTLAEFLEDIIRIDSSVLKGIDFASKQDLSNIFKFISFTNDNYQNLINDGNINRLQGYVAEQIARYDLMEMGYIVEMPETANQVGWDLLVDGQPFNIKNTANLSGLTEHFEKYPEIPVITNNQLCEKALENGFDNVYTLPDLDYQKTIDLTRETIEAGKDAMSFPVSWISLGISTFLNAKRVVQGETDIYGATINVATDYLGKAVGSIAGEKVISLVGLLLLGPAGGVIGAGTGAIIGGLLGKDLGKGLRKIVIKGKHEHLLLESISKLFDVVAKYGEIRLQKWQDKEQIIKQNFKQSLNGKIIEEFVMSNFKDNYNYYRDKIQIIHSAISNPKKVLFKDDLIALTIEAIALVQKTGVHPYNYQHELKSVLLSFEQINKDIQRFNI